MFKNPISEFVFMRTYSRFRKDLKRRETFEEAVDRYINFISGKNKDKIPAKVIRKIKQKILNLEVVPSMRAFWAAGPAAEKDNITMYNCSALVLDNIASFAEMLVILMCGSGVGFRVKKTDVEKLPVIPEKIIKVNEIFKIPDNKYGWGDSIKVLLTSLYSGKDISFDYNELRPEGARLETMGGFSSGPAPLIALHNYIKDVFYNARGRKLTTLEVHDIACEIESIVVVGGVRRSSGISLSDLDDELLAYAKSGNFPIRRYLANNSAIYNEKPDSITFLKEWARLAESGTGERGIFNLGAIKKNAPKRRNKYKIELTNPCVIGETEVLTKEGPKRIDSLVDKEVQVWNGFEWSLVTPKVTGENQEVLTISLSNGKSITCTNYHRFILTTLDIDNSFDNIIEAQDLQEGFILKSYKLPDGNYEYMPVIRSIKKAGIADKVYCFTEPIRGTGMFNGILTKNCGEIQLRKEQFCNLSEIVVREDDDVDSLLDKVETSVWIGAIQSTYTNFPYLNENWKNNCDEERLLGASITGQMDNPKLLTEEVLEALRKKANKVAKKASELLEINMPTAITTVKPSGTASLLLDCSPGIHARYARFYIRRFRISSIDPLCKMLLDQIKEHMSPETGQRKEDWEKAKNMDNASDISSVCTIFDSNKEWSEDLVNTWVVSFPVKAPDTAVVASELTALQQLEWYKKVQTNYCEHSTSCTIYVKPNEWFEVGNWVHNNWDYVNGLSFLPHSEHKYEQAPYEEIAKETYEKMLQNFPKIDYSKLGEYETEDHTIGSKELACSSGVCEIN